MNANAEALELIRSARDEYARKVSKARRALTEGSGGERWIALANNVLDETLTFVKAIDDVLAEV